ncbi:MAG TPA: phosphotransferase [Bacteroidales bacterium]|nr:phosphotransferase [Bacteroidales bacterium]
MEYFSKIEKSLAKLYQSWCNKLPQAIVPMPVSGSGRMYYRISEPEVSVIGVYNHNTSENEAFFHFTEQFQKNRINVPQILQISTNKHFYLISDLGNTTLFDRIKNENNIFNDDLILFYKRVIQELIRMQVIAGKNFDYSHAYPFKEFNKDAILFDLNYFREKFLDSLNIKYNDLKLRRDFNTLANEALKTDPEYFMFRDFQARNIMIFENEPYFIDYQGGRKGPLPYDLVSLLYQAKAQIPENTRELLMNYYINTAQLFVPLNKNEFEKDYNTFALIRVLQTLGAYGLRGIIEQKKHFIESIPFAVNNLLLINQKAEIIKKMPELENIIERIFLLEYNYNE